MNGLDQLDIRMSDSPGRSPHVTHEVGSPVRSVHPDLMESIHSQGDFGLRTTDYFDGSSTDSNPEQFTESRSPKDGMNMRPGRIHSTSKQRRSGNYLGGTTEQFRSHCVPEKQGPSPPSPKSPTSPTDFERYLDKHRSTHPQDVYGIGYDNGFESGESSLIESVQEMTPQRPPRHSNMHVEGLFSHSSPYPVQEEESPILPKPHIADRIKEVHHITMQALLGEGQALREASATPPRTTADRSSKYPTAADYRNSRYRSFSAPIRKVTMAPPPIDTIAASRNWPNSKAVKTPYPFRHIHRKEFGRKFSASEPAIRSPRMSDGVLTLSVRRSNPNSRLRLTTIIIPANSEFSSAKNRASTHEKQLATMDFDDAELFRQLRAHYKQLLGPWRLFSARSLSTICVSGTASRAADAGYGWLLTPRSPRTLAYKGLNDTFSEEKLLKFFRDPAAAGKSRYAWVSWAHRLADAPQLPAPLSPPSTTSAPRSAELPPASASSTSAVNNRFSMIRRLEQHEGLEFVVSWSAKRILAALATVILLSLAATLLWIFLGKSLHDPEADAGFRGAGDRVVSGVLMGICVLLIGLTGMGGWIGVSWLVL